MPESPPVPDLAETLPPPERLAVAYAPSAARMAWAGLLMLDRRLGRVAVDAREPMLAQLRLAWWRDRFRTPAGEWPKGEPLLAAMTGWDGERAALERLVDGWEDAIGGAADPAACAALAAARAGAVVALARVLGCGAPDAVAEAARQWSWASLPPALAGCRPPDAPLAEGGVVPRLPRAMRPLPILIRLSAAPRTARGLDSVRTLAAIIRLGLTGR